MGGGRERDETYSDEKDVKVWCQGVAEEVGCGRGGGGGRGWWSCGCGVAF